MKTGAGIVSLCALILTGCGTTATEPVLPRATLAPTATPTIALGFEVEATPVKVRVHHASTPTPRPTPFHAPAGPYLVLQPPSGQPTSQTIRILGGNLPTSVALQLVWSPHRSVSGISRTTYSDGHGALRTTFTAPPSPPGTYRITAALNGSVVASAVYRVTSAALLSATATVTDRGVIVSVNGVHFLKHLRLLLVAYPADSAGKPVKVGLAESSRNGSVSYSGLTRHLQPGQYLLRAWSASGLAAQMAEAYFDVGM